MTRLAHARPAIASVAVHAFRGRVVELGPLAAAVSSSHTFDETPSPPIDDARCRRQKPMPLTGPS
jgi:hypothetical protein